MILCHSLFEVVIEQVADGRQFVLALGGVDVVRNRHQAEPANFAAGTTQYELSQGNNSPWARRFTLDPMGLAALNPPMGVAP